MKRSINLRQIDAFRAVMITGSATEAAVLMKVTQPAVSRLISELERHVELQLFERHKGRLRATTEAKDLFAEVARTYTGLERIACFIENIKQVRTGHFYLTTSTPLAHSFVPAVVKEFLESHPDVSISVQIMVRREARAWLDSQQFDLALSTLPVDYPAHACETLAAVDAVCILPNDHPLTALTIIRPNDLHRVPYISFVPEALARFKTDAVFERAKVLRTLVVETQTAISICDHVAAGAGVSVIDAFTAHLFRNKLAIRAFRPKIRYEFGMLFPVRHPKSLVANLFADLIRRQMKAYVQVIQNDVKPHNKMA